MQREFLSEEELRELSGYTMSKYIRNWLKDNEISFFVDRLGNPKVNRLALRQLMGVETEHNSNKKKVCLTPNFHLIK